MTEENKLEKAIEEAHKLPIPDTPKLEKAKYFYDSVSFNKGLKNLFPLGRKTQAPHVAKLARDDKGQILIDSDGKTTTIEENKGIPIAVKNEMAGKKFWSEKGLITAEENQSQTWDEIHTFNRKK